MASASLVLLVLRLALCSLLCGRYEPEAHLCSWWWAGFMVQTVLLTMKIPPVALDMVVNAPIMQVVQVVQVSHFVIIPVVAQRLFPVVQTVLWTMEIPQSLFDKVVDVLVVQVLRVPQVLGRMMAGVIPQAQLVKNVVLIPVMSTCPVPGQCCRHALACLHGAVHLRGGELMGGF